MCLHTIMALPLPDPAEAGDFLGRSKSPILRPMFGNPVQMDRNLLQEHQIETSVNG